MTVRAHVDAVLGLLEAANLTVYPGKAPSVPSLPYVALYVQSGLLVPQSLTFESVRRDFGFLTTCVGVSQESTLWCVERVESALLDVVPVIPGRICWPIRQRTPATVRRDDDLPGTTESRFSAPVSWSFSSVPA